MQMNSGIILAGQQPDLVNVLSQSNQAAQQRIGFDRQNAIANMYQQQGPGIAAGDQDALNALARFDPMAAMGVTDTMQIRDIRGQENQRAQGRYNREAEEYARGLSAQQAQAEAAKIEAGVKRAMMAQTPEQFDQIMQASGMTDFVGQFDNRDALAAEFMSWADVLKMRGGGQGDSAKDQEIRRTQQAWGVDYATAQGIADGVLKVSQDPTTREIMVTNLATGETYAPSVSQGMPTGQPSVAPQAPTQTPAQPSAAPQSLTFGDAFQGADTAFGLEGVGRGALNTIADVAGLPVPFPESQQTRQDFEVLGESLVNDFASAYGRQPPSWLLQNIAALVPKAGSPFEGPQRAQTKLTSIARDMLSRRDAAVAQLARRLTPAERQEALALIAGIDATLARVDSAMKGFQGDGGQGGNKTSSGISWEIVE
jgi:hypothetical protein